MEPTEAFALEVGQRARERRRVPLDPEGDVKVESPPLEDQVKAEPGMEDEGDFGLQDAHVMEEVKAEEAEESPQTKHKGSKDKRPHVVVPQEAVDWFLGFAQCQKDKFNWNKT